DSILKETLMNIIQKYDNDEYLVTIRSVHDYNVTKININNKYLTFDDIFYDNIQNNLLSRRNTLFITNEMGILYIYININNNNNKNIKLIIIKLIIIK